MGHSVNYHPRGCCEGGGGPVRKGLPVWDASDGRLHAGVLGRAHDDATRARHSRTLSGAAGPRRRHLGAMQEESPLSIPDGPQHLGSVSRSAVRCCTRRLGHVSGWEMGEADTRSRAGPGRTSVLQSAGRRALSGPFGGRPRDRCTAPWHRGPSHAETGQGAAAQPPVCPRRAPEW